MKRAYPKDQHVADGERATRRRLPVLLAAGAVAAAAITWGGFAAAGTLPPSGVTTLSSADSDPTATPPASDAADAPVSEESSAPDPTSEVSSDSSSDSSSDAVNVPGQETGQHEGHGPDAGSDPGVTGSELAGTPLSGEEPAIISASGQQPGAQQEVSLGSAAAEPLAAAPAAGASDAGGAGDRTAGLTLRAPIDPAEVKNGSAALGGCLAEYGASGQCLPVVPPSMAEHAQQMVAGGISLDTMSHPWSCTEVRQLFTDGLSVRQAGVDPQRLDANGDGTACGADD